MKYVKTFESFRGNRKVVNEEFLGSIGKFIGNMFKKAKERINKTKGGKDIESIYQKYIKMITDEFAKTAKVNLNLLAADSEAETGKKDTAVANAATPTDPNAKTEEELAAQNASFKYNGKLINEAEVESTANPADTKLAVDTLKSKKAILDQIVKKLKDMALKEMDGVLKKYGGASSNPQLEIIITSKKDQFDLDYLNSQINYLEAAGDKTEINTIRKERDIIAKKIENDFVNFDAAKAVQYKEGDEVVYLLKDKKVEWDKLEDAKKEEIKKDPTSDESKKMVGVNKISKSDNGNFTLLDKDGNPTITKDSGEIISLLQGEDKFDTTKAKTDEKYNWSDSKFTKGEYKFEKDEEIAYWSNKAFSKDKDNYNGTKAFVGDQEVPEKVADGQIRVTLEVGKPGFPISKGKIIDTKKNQDSEKNKGI